MRKAAEALSGKVSNRSRSIKERLHITAMTTSQ
jgi:hypothetical protein